jgi:Membrane proteins related to metalloendopeptidases
MSSITEIIFAGQDHYITSNFGYRTMNGVRSFHYGTDYGTNLKNLPLYAIEQGSVYSKGYAANGAGYYIWIYYPRLDVLVGYYHMKQATTLAIGQVVDSRTFVGYTGTTGNSTGIHLHLGVKSKSTGEYYDPESYAKNYFNPVPTEPIGTPVIRDVSAKQIEVLTDTLRARKRPELNDGVVIGTIREGIYNIVDSRDMRHEASNGYLWYQVEHDMWIAYSDSWAAIYDPQSPIVPAPDDRDKIIAELQSQILALKKQNASQAAALKAVKEIVNEFVA